MTAADLEKNILRNEIERLTKELFAAKSMRPFQRKPLTDVAIGDIYVQWDATPGVSHADFARAIEQAHGIVEE